MPTDLMVLPDSFPDPRGRAGVAIADLDGDGRPELVLFMVQNSPGHNTAHYRVGSDLDDEGKPTGGWSPWSAVPDWFSWEDQGAAVAVADLTGDGQQDMVVFVVDNPSGQNNGLYRVGRNLDVQGNVNGGWSSWATVPDWFSSEGSGAGITVADVSGDGRQDLVVLMVDEPAGPGQGFYRVGRDLDREGGVKGGWSSWLPVPDWMSWPSQSVAVAVADLTGLGRQDLAIFLLGNPSGGHPSRYRIGRGLDREGTVTGGWGDWIVLTDPHAGEYESLGAASANFGSKTQLVVLRADPASQGIYVSATDPSQRRDQTEWVSDAPAQEDRLRRQPLAQALAARLRRFHKEDPGTSFLIHIDGAWGTGKSTLLYLLQQELEQEQEQEWLIIVFNAWRQSRVGTPWWALLGALRHDVGHLRRLPARGLLRLIESWARFRRAGAPFVLAFFVLLIAAAAVFALLRPPKLTFPNSVSLAQGTTAVLAALGILWAGALVAGRFLLWDSPRGAKLFEQSNTDPMRDVAEHFGWLIMKAKRPVVFFIDDLDRCKDSYVVELLDTVQTLVRDVKLPSHRREKMPLAASFVIAADGAWIRESYEKAYADFAPSVATPGRSLGHLFLDKLFQLHVPVPTIDAAKQQEYLRDILRVRDPQPGGEGEEQAVRDHLKRSSSEEEVIETLRNASPRVRGRVAGTAVEILTQPAIAAAAEHHLQRFGPLLEPNPRAMKRFVNDYGILRAVRTMEGNPVHTDPLALWAIIETRWPALADCLRSRPEAIELLGVPESGLNGVPTDLHGLFDDQNVRKLVNFEYGGPLTPELIRACCGAALAEQRDEVAQRDTIPTEEPA